MIKQVNDCDRLAIIGIEALKGVADPHVFLDGQDHDLTAFLKHYLSFCWVGRRRLVRNFQSLEAQVILT